MNLELKRTGEFYENQVVLIIGQRQSPLHPHRVINERHGVVAVEDLINGEVDHYRLEDVRVYEGGSEPFYEAMDKRLHDGRHYKHYNRYGVRRAIPASPEDKHGYWRDDEVSVKGSKGKHIVLRHDFRNFTYTVRCPKGIIYEVDEDTVGDWVEPQPEPKFKEGDPVRVTRGSLMGLNLTVVGGRWVESHPDGHYEYMLRKSDGHTVNGVDELIMIKGNPTPYHPGDLITPAQGAPMVVKVVSQLGYNVTWTNKEGTIGGTFNTCQIRLATQNEIGASCWATTKDDTKEIWEAIGLLNQAVAISEPRCGHKNERSGIVNIVRNLLNKNK